MLVATVNNQLQFINVNLSDPTCVNTFQCGSEIVGLQISYDNELLFCHQQNSTPVILNISDLDNIKVVDRIEALPSITVAKFRRIQGKWVVLGTSLSAIATYHIESKAILKVRSVPAPVQCICLNATDDRLLVGCTNKNILIFEPDKMEKLQVYKIESPVISMEFHPNQDNICGIQHEKNMLSIFNLDTNRFLVKKKVESMKDFCFVPAHHFVVTIGEGYRCSMLDLTNYKYVFHHNLPLKPVSIATVGKFIGIGGNDGTVILFDMNKYAFPWKRFQVAGSNIQCLRFFYNTKIDSNLDGSPSGLQQNQGSLVSKATTKPRSYCLLRKKHKRIITNNGVVFEDTPKRMLAQVSQDLITFARENVAETMKRVNKQLACFEAFVQTELMQIKEFNDQAWKEVMRKVVELDSVKLNNLDSDATQVENIKRPTV